MGILFGIMFYAFMAGLTGKIYEDYYDSIEGACIVAGIFWPVMLPIHIGIWIYNEMRP